MGNKEKKENRKVKQKRCKRIKYSREGITINREERKRKKET